MYQIDSKIGTRIKSSNFIYDYLVCLFFSFGYPHYAGYGGYGSDPSYNYVFTGKHHSVLAAKGYQVKRRKRDINPLKSNYGRWGHYGAPWWSGYGRWSYYGRPQYFYKK